MLKCSRINQDHTEHAGKSETDCAPTSASAVSDTAREYFMVLRLMDRRGLRAFKQHC